VGGGRGVVVAFGGGELLGVPFGGPMLPDARGVPAMTG